jgi:hypothetical protein
MNDEDWFEDVGKRMKDRRGLCSFLLAGTLLTCLNWSPLWAQELPELDPTPAPRSMSKPADLKTALEECKTHPSVVAAGTPFEICVEGYGFVKEGDRGVQKPATR